MTLGKLPFEQVALLISSLQKQVDAQAKEDVNL